MTQLFISYSRQDLEFSRKLTASLEHLGFQSWIDWNDIPPTADWWEQIEKGIETADTFLFLLSPDSVISETCRKEIEHALQNGKRIIPLVVCEVTPDTVHPALARLNWVFFRPEDNYNTSLKKLDTALRIDLAWVENHRRLQVRALEWEKRRERSLLLRGDDLKQAEENLSASSQKDPSPTDLQRRYILESRRSASRTRNLVGLLSVILAVTLGIATLIAALKGSQANTEADSRATAEANALAAGATAEAARQQTVYEQRQARIGQLNAQSELLRDDSPSTALLLALEAAHLSDTAAEPFPNETLQTLRSALASVQGQALYANSTSVTSILYSSDERWLAAAGKDGVIRLWDQPETGSQPILLTGHEGAVNAITFNAASNRLASGGEDGVIRIWDLESIDPAAGPQEIATGVPITSLAWSSQGRWLAAGLPGQVAFVDTTTPVLAPIIYEPEVLTAYYFAYIYDSTGNCDYQDEPWANGDGPVLPEKFGFYTNPYGPMLDDVSSRCYYDVRVRTSGSDIYVTASPDGNWFAATNPFGIVLWHIESQTGELTEIPVNEMPSLPNPSITTFSSDSHWLVSNPDVNSLQIVLWPIPPQPESQFPYRVINHHGGEVLATAFNPQGNWLAVSTSYQNELFVIETSATSLAKYFITPYPDPADTGGGFLFPAMFYIEQNDNPITALEYSPDGRWLAGASDEGDGATRLWDLNAEDPEKSVTTLDTNSSHPILAFSPDGRWLAVSSENMLVRLFNMETMEFNIDQTILDNLNGMDFSELSDIVCQSAARNLTRTEWVQYGFTEEYRATCPQWMLEP